MKTLKLMMVVLFALLVLVSTSAAPPFLYPSNPPPSVSLTWNANVESDLAGYKIYWGAVSGGYTNRITVGLVTDLVFTNLVRGQKVYFAATAYNAVGLESTFSNEISYTAPMVPAAPGLKPIVVLTVQSSPKSASPVWTDYTNAPAVALLPEDEQKYFRLQIASVNNTPAAKAAAPAKRVIPMPPPVPGSRPVLGRDIFIGNQDVVLR